jgi:hypothetical protein
MKLRSSRRSATTTSHQPLLRLTDSPPNPLGRKVLWTLLALLAALLLLGLLGQLDIVAVAEGKLIPQSYLKIVQPAESGIVKEILVSEGETVRAGQVLMRMDTRITDADFKSIDGRAPAQARDARAYRRRTGRSAVCPGGRRCPRTVPGNGRPIPCQPAKLSKPRWPKRKAVCSRRVTSWPRPNRSAANLMTRCRTTAHRTRPSTNWPGMASPAR